ncbi:PTS system protein [Klebsiella pneumoniae]|uniref:PTS system protein n=1 Tax=Klebsiella pneumoniae TaxID=573 RepID=A0A378FZL7_KLEPN|nr:PTS system protein [Klebsiella pneumoniae]
MRTITVAFQHAADKAAENGNLTALSWLHVSSLFLQAMRIAIPAVIVAISVGTSEVQGLLNAIPEVVTSGLNIAGGMIVVVGYAMVINMMRAGYLMPVLLPRLRHRRLHQLQPGGPGRDWCGHGNPLHPAEPEI